MILSVEELAKMLEVGRLEPWATQQQIVEACATAIQYSCGAFFVSLGYVPIVAEELKKSDTKLGVPIGFPLGTTSPEVKAFETQQAAEAGAEELDMCINRQRLKSGDYEFVYEDIRAVVDAAGDGVTKVIFQTCELTEEEIIRGSELAKKAGARF